MNDDPTLSAVLADLRAIRSWCSNHHKHPPESAVKYLATNQEVLRFFIRQLYSTTTEAQRCTIHSQHRELDETAVQEDWGSLADSIVETAVQLASGNGLAKFTDSDIPVLLRPIEYVKHLESCPYCESDLSLSPICLP